MALYVIKTKTSIQGASEEIVADNYTIMNDGSLFFYNYEIVGQTIEQGVASFSKDSWTTVILRKK